MTRTPDFNQIAGFRFRRLLGSGSFAHTYEAERDGERFAVKVFYDLPATAIAQERFRREVLSLRISHPNLTEYVDSGVATYGGKTAAYIAMRYLPGRSLRERLGDGRIGWLEALGIAQGIACGLTCLHERGVMHRDLKPANVYLPIGGGIVILDFGLARVQDLTTITARGAFVGTLAYTAPEQIRGESDFHSDLYSLGAVLFEALTGRPPFVASNELELIDCIRHEHPEPAVAIEPSVPLWLDDLVLSLLAKEPLQRPRGVQMVYDALRDPPRRASKVVSDPYDRDDAPLLVARVTGNSGARAVVDLALQDRAADVTVAAVTQPSALDELHRARCVNEKSLAIDTKVLDTATGGYGSIAALRGRKYLPQTLEPHTPDSLRPSSETNRVARGDIQEQINEGASLLRSTAFSIDVIDGGWLRRNPRLLEASLSARDALAPSSPLYAVVPCTIDSLSRHDARLSIVNRFARGDPDGYWVGVADIENGSPVQISAALDLVLMLQHLGSPCIWVLPGTLAEFAWSMGVAGVEIHLGRVGGFKLPTSVRPRYRAPGASRFEFASLMTSLQPDLAVELLESNAVPESDCQCPSCSRAATTTERVAHADEHNLWIWTQLRDLLGAIDANVRTERYATRLASAARKLTVARRVVPALRSFQHITLANQAMDVVMQEGILDTPRRLRRAS